MAAGNYTSKRGYLSQTELAQYADISITDETEADDQISQAEEMIDQYVGFQDKFYHYTLQGKASAGSTSTLTLDTNHVNNYPYTDYFKGCTVEIISGPGAGDRKKVTGSTSTGVLTCETFSAAITTSSVYRIYQLGKFPRHKDVFINTNESPTAYYKTIPEAVKRATAAQVEYMIQMGTAFFATAGGVTSESIGDYSYTKESESVDMTQLIAPKARQLLIGILNRKGQMDV